MVRLRSSSFSHEEHVLHLLFPFARIKIGERQPNKQNFQSRFRPCCTADCALPHPKAGCRPQESPSRKSPCLRLNVIRWTVLRPLG